MWMRPYLIKTNSYDKFQDECSKYIYYNCNSELGEHLAYYITEEYKKYLIRTINKFKAASKTYFGVPV